MILGGNATLYVSDMDAAVRFYTEVLGMRLRFRAENHWAEVEAGKGFVIGLHPVRPGRLAGAPGAVQIGLLAEAPLEDVLETLARRGVKPLSPIKDAGPGMRFADIADMDGNEVYLWESSKGAAEKRPAKRPAKKVLKKAARPRKATARRR